MGLIFPNGSVESGSTDSFYKRYPCIRILQTDFGPMWGGGGENNANVIYEWPQSLLSWYSSSSKFAKSLIQVPLPRKSLHKSLSHVVLEGDFNEPQKQPFGFHIPLLFVQSFTFSHKSCTFFSSQNSLGKNDYSKVYFRMIILIKKLMRYDFDLRVKYYLVLFLTIL